MKSLIVSGPYFGKKLVICTWAFPWCVFSYKHFLGNKAWGFLDLISIRRIQNACNFHIVTRTIRRSFL